MSIATPDKNWWKPLDKNESTWLKVAIVVGLFFFFMMPIYHLMGKQNNTEESYRIAPQAYQQKVDDFVAANQKMDESGAPVSEQGIPIVSPKSGIKDIYLRASMWMWYPILELEKNREYRLHISSIDVQHGFSLQPKNINFQVVPGYDQVVTFTPREAGTFYIICNEYCMINHHTMISKLYVK